MRKGQQQTEEAKNKMSKTRLNNWKIYHLLPSSLKKMEMDDDTYRVLKSKIHMAVESIWGLGL
jgi:hypothetical protein